MDRSRQTSGTTLLFLLTWQDRRSPIPNRIHDYVADQGLTSQRAIFRSGLNLNVEVAVIVTVTVTAGYRAFVTARGAPDHL